MTAAPPTAARRKSPIPVLARNSSRSRPSESIAGLSGGVASASAAIRGPQLRLRGLMGRAERVQFGALFVGQFGQFGQLSQARALLAGFYLETLL